MAASAAQSEAGNTGIEIGQAGTQQEEHERHEAEADDQRDAPTSAKKREGGES